jgi:hypothetical protein
MNNHDETLVQDSDDQIDDDTFIDELEPREAPALPMNHNETLVRNNDE